VMGGVARRSWARNANAIETATLFNEKQSETHITLPYLADEDMVTALVEEKLA